MKFYEGEEELKNIIQSYTMIGDSMIINYLDGSSFIIENVNNERIKMTEEMMLKQLKDRNNNFNFNNMYLIGVIDAISLGVLEASYISEKLQKTELQKLITFFCTIALFYNLISKLNKMKDVEKTNLFLDMYDELQSPEVKIIISNMLKDKLYTPDLTINTVDDFSYRTIKQIHKKVKKL